MAVGSFLFLKEQIKDIIIIIITCLACTCSAQVLAMAGGGGREAMDGGR
jgi:hypothetical protein